ncbi:MAG TPA: CpsB/CapC family capsule biosynthesis tyrosine phosphatase [Terriglobales bacterium]|nr:CpsB/CapC family capsule biosynthesis tyrosine phosphatase [Terriglobales bacterium]
MVDIHCHILPGVDDGARDWETSLAMCRIAARDGIRHIVATPHANDEFQYDRPRLQALLAELHRLAAQDAQIAATPLTFSLGCDFHLSFENFRDALARPERYCIQGTRYLLVEFSDYVIPPNTEDLFCQLGDLGIRPIVTHPERNRILAGDLKRVLRWADEGAIIQVTANAFTGRWGKQAEKTARALMDRGAVHVVASDAHGTGSRPPLLSEARSFIAKRYGEQLASALVDANPGAIVRGLPLPRL